MGCKTVNKFEVTIFYLSLFGGELKFMDIILNDTLMGERLYNSRKNDTIKVKKLYKSNLKSHESVGRVTFLIGLVQFFHLESIIFY